MSLRPTIIALVLFWLAVVPARARRPWQPNLTVEAAECIGQRKTELSRKAIKQFDRLYKHGQFLFAEGRYRLAQKKLSQAIALNPDHVGARTLRARILLTLGYLNWSLPMIQKAHADIRHALQQDPKNQNTKAMIELLDGLLKRMTSAPRKSHGKPR